MEVIEFRPEREQYAFTFGGVAPVRKIHPGTALKLWTDDAFCGNIRQVTDLPSSALTMPFVNPQTGPFHVVGAEPGDTLALHFVDLTPARSFGASCAIPLFGGLTSTDRTATLQDPLPERTWIYDVDRERQTVAFQARASGLRVELPMDPMLGTVGVAPAAGEVRSSLVPDTFGGNMDTPEMRAGATCYLAVNVDGALFSVGDGHHRQGEGEACGTAVEGAMDVMLIVDLIKGGGPAWPRLETDDHLIVVGSSRPLEDAWRVSQVGMVTWLMELYGLDRMDAYQLLSQTSQAPLANVVDANYSAVAKVPKAQLGGIDIVIANVSALAIPDEPANWQASFEVDLMHVVRLVNAAMPHLEKSDAASIVTIASVSGREIDFAAGPYATFKAALIHYTQGLAYQLAPKGIRANSVSPGNTYFPGGVWENIEQHNPELFAQALALNPTGRMARPEEIARAVVFMASPAASFISGTNLVADGALTRGVQF